MDYNKEEYEYLAFIIKNSQFGKKNNFKPIDIFKYFNIYDYNKDFLDIVKNQLSKYYNLNDAVYKIIVKYVKNNINVKIYPINKEIIYKNKVYIDNFLVTKETIDVILEYMNDNSYPNINFIYSYLLREYLYNNLNVATPNSKILKFEKKKNNS